MKGYPFAELYIEWTMLYCAEMQGALSIVRKHILCLNPFNKNKIRMNRIIGTLFMANIRIIVVDNIMEHFQHF